MEETCDWESWIEDDQTEVVLEALKRGADPNAVFGWTCLDHAIDQKNDKFVKFLLSRGAGVNHDNNGWTPLKRAIYKGPSMVYLMISFGADVSKKFLDDESENPVTPFEFAWKKNKIRSCGLLADAGCLVEVSSKKLDIRDQNLEILPLFLGKVPHLETLLCLRGNALLNIPESIKSKGDDSVLEYLQDLARPGNKTEWRRAKVMVLGQEGVGKTHLYHCVRETKYPGNISTVGIDVHTFTVNGMDLTWFDFGGQEVFYPTHQFFLTSQCVYLVVFNLNEPDFLKRVVYWLRNITNFAKDSSRPAKVVVVGTHLDELEEGAEDEVFAQLQRYFKESGNVVGYAAVSCCRKGKAIHAGIDAVTKGIAAAVEEGKLGVIQIPKLYERVFHWIMEMREEDNPKLSLEKVLESFHGVKEWQLEQALEFLHDMGQCFFDKKLRVLILDVQWLADTFSGLITFRHNFVKNGVVLEAELRHIYAEKSKEEIEEFMALMQKFEVAFPKREEGKWIVPSLLPEQRHGITPIGTPTHERIYKMDVLPLGLFGRLIARLQEWEGVELLEIWRFGMCLKSKEGKQFAELTVDVGGEKPIIRVKCQSQLAQKGRLLIQRMAEEMASLFQTVFRRTMGKPVQQFIVCPHCLKKHAEKPRLLKVEDCVAMVTARKKRFQCGKDKEKVAILGDDVTFGHVRVFEEAEVELESDKLASGGFGDIFKGKVGEEQIVAKELKPDKAADGFGEFQHEVAIMSKLEHANLVKLHGIMLNPLRMILEYCSCGDLFHALHEGKIGTKELKGRVAVDIALGMNFLHCISPPIAHRDLRSPNVFLVSLDAKKVCAKVGDFGLSVAVGQRLEKELETWQWMAPEAQMGNKYDERCDLYSFGIVLYEIYSAKFPFSEYTEMRDAELHAKNLHQGLRPTVPEDVHDGVRELIEDLWRQDPSERPPFFECVSVLEKITGLKVKAGLKLRARRTRSSTNILVALGKVVHVLEDQTVRCMERIGNQVWIGMKSGKIVVFDTMQGSVVRELKQSTEKQVWTLCLGGNGEVWSGAEDGSVETWHTNDDASKKKLTELFAQLFRKEGVKRDVSQPHLDWIRADVKSICKMGDMTLTGDVIGRLVLWNKQGEDVHLHLFAKRKQHPILFLVPVQAKEVWVAAGRDILSVSMETERLGERNNINQPYELANEVVQADAHPQFIQGMVCVGQHVWTCGGGELRVWEVKGKKCVRTTKIGRAHCLALVNVKGKATVWMGGDDEIKVFDAKTRTLLKILIPQSKGDVTEIAEVGVNCVWTVTKRKKGTEIEQWEMNF